jgi:hypothetical protein
MAMLLLIVAGGCGHRQDTTSGSIPGPGKGSEQVAADQSDTVRRDYAKIPASQSVVPRAVHGDEGGLLAITLTGPAVLSITDPRGRYLRYDAAAGGYVSNIPESVAERGTIGDTQDSTASTPPSDRIEVPSALLGDYRVEVIGQAEGWFGISISDYDTEGALTGWSGTGTASPGSRAVYIVRYSPTPDDSIKVREVAADSLQRR